jgi:hypothetical protein
MANDLFGLLDTTGFPARWHCGRWSAPLGWLHIVSDILIFGAYMAIPIVLMYFIRQRPDLPKPFPIVFWLFGAFIVACGTTHALEALIFWQPVYRLAGAVGHARVPAAGGSEGARAQVTRSAQAASCGSDQ